VGSVSDTASDRVKTDVKIDMASMQNATTLFLWAKNIGSAEVPATKLAYTDIYFGETGSMARAGTAPEASFRWAYVLDDADGNGDWDPGETMQIAITDDAGTRLTAGTHDLQLVLYNSASFKETITI
jgi:flagellar protein FlaG